MSMYRYCMTNGQTEINELWDIAVFLRMQLPETQNAIRSLHKQKPEAALFLIRDAMNRSIGMRQ